MSSQSFFAELPACHITKPLDILNLLRDENFPKLPSFAKTQPKELNHTKSCVQIANDFCENTYENQAYVTPIKPSKKKGVVFSQDLEQHRSISPKKMDLDQIRVNLSKRAKKSILIRKPGLLSSSNLSESTKPSLSNAQGILSLSSVTSMAFDMDFSKEPTKSTVKTPTSAQYQQENEKRTKEILMPTSMEIMALDVSDVSSISIEDEELIMENKTEKDNEKNLSNKSSHSAKREVAAISSFANLKTFQSQLKAQLSFSAMVAPIEPPQLKKNQSAIIESLNDPSSSQGNQTNALTRRRHVISKTARVTPGQGLSSSVTRGGSESQRPVPKTLRIPMVESIQKMIPLNSSDVRKIQTPSNNRLVIKTTTNLPSTPSNQSRPKILATSEKIHKDIEPQSTQANSNISNREAPNVNPSLIMNFGANQDNNNNNKGKAVDTFCVKNGNQLVLYSFKEGHYKTFEYEQSVFLDGSAFCKGNNDTVIVTGGSDSQSKLVSSKTTLVNYGTNAKEVLPGMPIARYNHGMTLHGKTLYTIGGQSFEGKVLKSCYVLELGSKNWARIPSLKFERANPLIFTSSKTGNLYVLGGTDSEGNEVPWVEKLDVQKQTWQLVCNAAKFDLCSKDMMVLGSCSNNSKSEETLILVKDSISKNGGGKHLLFSFDADTEVLGKKGDFGYETNNSGAFGFLNGNNVYLTEKTRLNMLDVYILDSQIWAHKRLKQV